MSVDGHRTSVFTFQSAVHSSHVLRSLDEQRQNDVLCDVTVLVESRSYRAHSSVLASCSDFFHSKFLGHASQSRVITLPDNVTVEGFEPLLQFAYTAKLLFTKDNILEIHQCAKFLGFHNLDQSCFEFLIPKFHKDACVTTDAEKAKRKSCGDKGHQCNDTTTSGQDLGPGDVSVDISPNTTQAISPNKTQDISQTTTQDSIGIAGQCLDPCLVGQPSQPSTSMLPEENLTLGFPSPKSPAFPEAHGQDQFCLQNCGPELQPSLSTAPEQVCPFLKMVGSSGDVGDSMADETMLDLASSGCPNDVSMETCPILDQQSQSPLSGQIGVPEACSPPPDQAMVRTPNQSSQRLCQLNSPEPLEPGSVMGSTDAESDLSFDTAGHAPSCITSMKTSGNRSSVEREVAEHLAKGFWCDLGASLSEPMPLDEVVEQSASENASAAADFHWLKHLDLSSTTGECPFLRNLGSEEAQTPVVDCSNLPQQEKSPSPCMSPINSEDDLHSDTEGEREGRRERAEEIQLPFPVEQIPNMTRSAFQQMLRQQNLTQEQLEFVHDVRRRSKNRVAAQRSRKRKLDCIRKLECEIKKLRGQKEKLLQERSHLKLSMGQTLQGLSGLCQAVCGEAGPQPDQLQLLAQHLSPNSPSSVLLTPMASPNLAGQERDVPGPDGSGSGSSSSCGGGSATKEPSEVEAATPCLQAEPAMPEENEESREDRTCDGLLRDDTAAP
ncbi:transcription regulator protein BACH1-like [Alosa sapidissima]|uniref:transcription regulator protein BACH1-like n=1 Tax=Alosa sapidissima TaxID=34773 RepID=UPI001C09D54A|nr:transcription regulator protein BACH1-like [Alosa sapidissima]